MNKDTLNPTGHLVIHKVYPDRSTEIAYSDHNVITSGMGVGLSHLLTASGGTSIVDFQILNYSVGTGGNINTYGASTYTLNTPLTAAQYGSTGSEIVTESMTPIENGALVTAKDFPRIKYSNIHRVTKTSVRFTLVIDRYSCNGLANGLDEVGLFMRNPRGLATHSPILVAYRPHTEIQKTDAFALVYQWTLSF